MAQVNLNTNVIIGGKANASFTNLVSRLQSLATTVNQISSQVLEFEKDSVSTYKSYEDNMLQAETRVMNYYDSQTLLNQTMKDLKTYASNWAASSIFHTSDVSQAISEASAAGWDLYKILKGIPATMTLAQAGSIDLSTALDYVVKTMNGTRTEFSDVTTVVDQWTMAANRSSTTIDEMGRAMKNVGAAGSLAGSTQDLYTMLAVLADTGTTAEKAGTQLRGMMLRLVAPTSEKAMNYMEQLGLTTEEYEEILAEMGTMDDAGLKEAYDMLSSAAGFSAYDAAGNLKPMVQVFTELADAIDQLPTEEEQNRVLAAIFPTRTFAGARAMLDAARSGKLGTLYDEIGDSAGYASEVSQIMMSGLTGSIETLKSKWEEFQKKVGESLAPAIEKVATALGNLIDWVNGLDEGTFNTFVSGLTMLAAEGTGLVAVTGFLKFFSLLGVSGTIFVAAGVGIAMLVTAIQNLENTNFKNTFGDLALSLTDLKADVEGIDTVFTAQAAAINAFEAALLSAQSTYSDSATSLAEKTIQYMLAQHKLTESEEEQVLSYADSMLAAGSSIDSAQSSMDAFLATMLSGDMTGFGIASLVTNAYFADVKSSYESAGQELRSLLVQALEDDVLSAEEQKAIQSSINRLNEIQAQITSGMTSEAYYKQLYKGQTVSWDSISSYIESNNESLASAETTIQDTYASKYALLARAYETAADNGTVFEYNGESFQVTREMMYDENDPHSLAYITKQIRAQEEAALESERTKYSELNARAFDTLMTGSDYSLAWNYLKYLGQGGQDIDEVLNALTGNGEAALDVEAAGLSGWSTEDIMELSDQLTALSHYGKLRDVLSGYSEDSAVGKYLGYMNSAGTLGDVLSQHVSDVSTTEDSNASATLASLEAEEAYWQKQLDSLTADRAAADQAYADAQDRLANDNGFFYRNTIGFWNNQYADTQTVNAYPDLTQKLDLDISDAQNKVATLQAAINQMANVSLNVSVGGNKPGYVKGNAYAEGGRATEASIFGEAGPEWAIPEEHSARTASLLDAARRASGFTWGDLIARYGGLNGGTGRAQVVVSYAPTINAGSAEGVADALAADKAALERLLRRVLDGAKLREGAAMYV